MRVRAGRLVSAAVIAVFAIIPARGGADILPILPLNRPLCGSAAGAPAATSPSTLRVATFNVLHGLEEEPAYPTHSTFDARLELQAQAVAGAAIDLVGMQEVSLTEDPVGHAPGLQVERLADRLAEITGGAWYWCWHLSNPHLPIEPDIKEGGGGPLSDVIASMSSSNYGSFKEGSAVLSRYPILASEGRRLPLRVPLEPLICPPAEIPTCNETALFDHRIAVWARVDTPGGATDIVTTHLAHHLTQLSETSKAIQALAVVEFAEEMEKRHGEAAHRFITCDCNLTRTNTPDGVGLIIKAGWTDTYAAVHPDSACEPGQDTSGCTSDQDILSATSTTTERIDYVFARAGTCGLDVLGAEKYANTPSPADTSTGWLWPSDHQATWADVAAGPCGVAPVGGVGTRVSVPVLRNVEPFSSKIPHCAVP